ncbi:MAG: amidohydrolase family protein [Kiritimatiellae bacterium]|nr:amidohydrolase family protein [Kiritimatiellia bacterium]
MRIDMHTHAFADGIARHALDSLMSHMAAEYFTKFDGRLSTLVSQLRAHGFDRAVLCQIATKPEHFVPIMAWSKAILAGEFGEDAARMIIPLPSVHPADPERHARLAEVARCGFKGVKLHPYFQHFTLDSPDMLDYFRAVADAGLFAEVHCGYDAGFPFEEICGPRRVARVIGEVPSLRFMVTHLGGWQDWDEAARILIGQPIDIEMSMTVGMCEPSLLRDMLMRHPGDRIYFGSDWPWSDHAKILPFLAGCGLPQSRMEALMGGNAERWLGIAGGAS